MERFEFIVTPIEGLKLVKRKRIEDERGFLTRVYSENEFTREGMSKPIVQINHTMTRKAGALRGMHYQLPPYAETKLVNCLQGEIFDVSVDLRKGSATYLKWHAEVLSAENLSSLIIPEGVAHGFQALSDNCELLYFHTTAYHPDAEAGLNARDPKLGIEWPLEILDISERDISHPFIDEQFAGITL